MRIFVVGYPKSGNTWLAKMMCQAFGAKLVDDDPTQLEVNERLASEDQNREVIKSHFLPEQLFETYGNDDCRIAYVLRDFRDVSVSAYYYFHTVRNQHIRIDADYLESIKHLQDPDDFGKNRIHFRDELISYATTGLPGLPQFKRWDEHISIWTEWGRQNPGKFHAIRYEDLLADAEGYFGNALDDLGLKDQTVMDLKTVVENESFSKRKKQFEQSKDSTNTAFMRKGKAGDWANYYTQKIGSSLSPDLAMALVDYGYAEQEWISKLPAEVLGPADLSQSMGYLKSKVRSFIR